ncbi:MAG: YjzC family protein, partial [Planctomycetes bacterium]|nr:YjzC family protein [Planctomycetota bacterium]
CYLYYSFLTDEPDKAIRKIWEQHLVVELSHLHAAKDLFEKYEKRQWEEVVPAEFPTLIRFKQTKEYVRDILENTVENTASQEDFASIEDIPEDHGFYRYQTAVNKSPDMVTSHRVIETYQDQSGDGRDYRFEESPNPVPELVDRSRDNTSLGRLPKDRWEDEEDDDSMAGVAQADIDVEEDVDDMDLEESVAIASDAEAMDEADVVDEEMDENEYDSAADGENEENKPAASYKPGKQTVSRIKEEIKEEILEELRDEIADSRCDDDAEEDDGDETYYDPGQTAPYSGIYAMVDSSGEPTGSERTVVKGQTFPPSGKSGQSYKLARGAKNAAGKI